MHNKELHVLYSSPIIIRVMMTRRRVMAGNMARGAYGGEERCIQDFGGET